MRSNTEIPNISATLLSPRIRASINDEPDIKRELDSPTPKRPRISVSSQELLDQLSVVHEGARRFVTNTGNLASLEHSSTGSQRSSVPHPPPTRSPLARRGPLRTVILNPGGTNSRWIPGGANERSNTGHSDSGSFGGYRSNSNSERGSQRTVHTRRSPHHHPHHHNHREYHHNVRRSPNHYHNYHNQHHTLHRRNTRQRERERERNRAAAIAAARAVAANLQDSFNDIVGEEVCITEFWHSHILHVSYMNHFVVIILEILLTLKCLIDVSNNMLKYGPERYIIFFNKNLLYTRKIKESNFLELGIR